MSPPGRGRRDWWRRNWWALLALLPLLVAVVWFHPDDPYQRWRDARPGEPVAVGVDGWAEFRGESWEESQGVRLRLVSLAPVELVQPSGEPYPLADGLRAWLATVAVQRLPDTPASCEFQLEDDSGRLFGDSPPETELARLEAGASAFSPGGCVVPDEAPDGRFETLALFALPEAAQPAAVRVTLFLERDYVRLPWAGAD